MVEYFRVFICVRRAHATPDAGLQSVASEVAALPGDTFQPPGLATANEPRRFDLRKS